MRNQIQHSVTMKKFLSLSSLILFGATHTQNLLGLHEIIYHAFDESYNEIEEKIDVLSNLGFTHIQISPPQESRNTLPYNSIDRKTQYKCEESISRKERTCPVSALRKIESRMTVPWDQLFDEAGRAVYSKKPWYLHYQPSSYKISDTYGSMTDLRRLITKAKRMKPSMGIIVDAVLVHMRAPDQIEKIEWKEARKSCSQKDNIKAEMACAPIQELYQALIPNLSIFIDKKATVNDLNDMIFPWSGGHYEGGWPSSAMPAFKVLHPSIQSLHDAYIKNLLSLNVAGMRFDVARQLPSASLKRIQAMVPQSFILYGEVIENDPAVLKQWKSERGDIGVTAYHMFNQLRKAFSFAQDINELDAVMQYLPEEDVIFVATHDSITGGLDNYYKMMDASSSKEISQDLILAQQFLLGSFSGKSLILPELVDHNEIKEALRFRRHVKVPPKKIFVDWRDPYDGSNFSQYTYVLRHGDQGFMAINKHGTKDIDWNIVLHLDRHLNGCYTRVDNKLDFIKISSERKDQKKIEATNPLKRRSAAFFVKVPDASCSSGKRSKF